MVSTVALGGNALLPQFEVACQPTLSAFEVSELPPTPR